MRHFAAGRGSDGDATSLSKYAGVSACLVAIVLSLRSILYPLSLSGGRVCRRLAEVRVLRCVVVAGGRRGRRTKGALGGGARGGGRRAQCAKYCARAVRYVRNRWRPKPEEEAPYLRN